MTTVRTLAIAAALSLQAHAAAAGSNDQAQELDRVEVHGTTPELWKLREVVIEAEDRFYAKYNEVNVNDDFDVNCRVEAKTGTRLKARTCRPLYKEYAVQEGAKQAVEVRQRFQAYGGEAQLGASSPPVPCRNQDHGQTPGVRTKHAKHRSAASRAG